LLWLCYTGDNRKGEVALAKALIVVDMQNDFVKGHMSTPEALGTVAVIREKLERSRADGDWVVFTADTHLDEEYGAAAPAAEAARLPKHCIRGTAGWQIIDELRPYADEVFEKPTFLGLGLEERLAGRISDTPGDVIELCGVCTDICVLSNALYLRAKYPRARIVVDQRACAGVTPAAHEAALTAMRSCLVQVL